MKMYKVTITRSLIFLFALLAARSAFAQPAYNVYITNESYPTNKTYQFDIWIKKTGTGPLDISNLQFGIDINPLWRGAGTITPTIAFNGTVANSNGSSMFSSGLKPTGSNFSYTNLGGNSGNDRLNISANLVLAASSGTDIPDVGINSGTGGGGCNINGVRYATVQLSNSAVWSNTSTIKPNVTINFNSSPVLQTKVSYFNTPYSSNSSSLDATPAGTFYDYTVGGTCSQNLAWPGSATANSNISATTVTLTQPSTCTGTGSIATANTYVGALTSGQARYSIDGVAKNIATASSTSSSFTFTAVASGMHFIKIERGTGLTLAGAGTVVSTATIYVLLGTVTAPLSAIDNLDNPITCQGGTTTITITASGGKSPYTGDGTQTVSAGPYSFTITDACGTTFIVSGTVADGAAPPVINSATHTNATCATCPNGTITVSASGGTGPLAYSILGDTVANNDNSGATNGLFTAVAPDGYTVNVMDSIGCAATSARDTVGVNAVTCNITASATSTGVSCFGGSNGTATASASGAVGSVSYLWSNGQTTNPATGLTSGTYTVTVTDNGVANCATTATAFVSQPAALSASSGSGTIACNGGSTTVTVTASGGTAPYSGTGSFTKAAGTYTFTVTDNNGCTAATSITVTQPSTITASSSSGTIACNGGSTTVTVSASGGTAPYSGTGSFTRAAGTYSFTVTDSHGCTASTSITVTQPTAVTASSSSGTIACNGGSTTVTVSASGGTAPYSGTGSFTRTAGTYSFTVTDNNGCTASTSITITQPVVLGVSATSNTPVCAGTTLHLSSTVTGGTAAYSYAWTGPSAFSSTGANPSIASAAIANGGTYSLTVTDAHGCSASTTTSVTVQNCNITLNITAYLEGLYISSHTMKTPLYTLFGNSDSTASDTITVNLWATAHTSNSTPDFSTKVILHKNGTATATFVDNGTISGNPFYIAIKHRNHLETWSKTAPVFSSTTSYNFSTAQSQAYDDGINYNLPMRNMGSGVFAFYAGDVNHDGVVDLSDMQVVDNDTQGGAFGYNASDISGNGATGIEDMAFIDNNVNVYSNPPLTMSRPH